MRDQKEHADTEGRCRWVPHERMVVDTLTKSAWVEKEDTEPATSSQAPAVAAPIRLFVTRDDETMEQEGLESKRQRTVAGLPVCSLTPVDEIPVSYVPYTRSTRHQCMTTRRVSGWLHIWYKLADGLSARQ